MSHLSGALTADSRPHLNFGNRSHAPGPFQRQVLESFSAVHNIYSAYGVPSRIAVEATMHSYVAVAFAVNVLAREITFPPIIGVQHPFGVVGIDGGLDLSAASYSGLTTFANLPYVHCLAKEEDDVERYDIAILGAPFDTVGTSS